MADDEQFSLCWNNFNSNLSAGFHESLCRGDLVDVTLAAEGQFVKAHRLVLSVCSPYFRKMFTQMPANQHAFVFLKDVSHTALKDLIQFMYCGEVNVKQEALPAFISTAEALQIKGLTDSDPPPSQSPAEPSTPTPQIQQISSPRVRQRTSTSRSYKIETVDDSGDDNKPTQILIQTSAPAPAQVTTLVAAPQQHQTTTTAHLQQQAQQSHHQQQHQIVTATIPTTTTVVSHKRPAQRSIGATAPHIKRTKSTIDSLDTSAVEAASAAAVVSSAAQPQQITVQTATVTVSEPKVQSQQQQTQHQETEYIDLPIELPTKSEPDYADDGGADVEGDHEAAYVEDDTYGDLRYDESYFTENEEVANPANTSSATTGNAGTSVATTSKAIIKQQAASFSDSSYVDAGDQGNNDAQGYCVALPSLRIRSEFRESPFECESRALAIDDETSRQNFNDYAGFGNFFNKDLKTLFNETSKGKAILEYALRNDKLLSGHRDDIIDIIVEDAVINNIVLNAHDFCRILNCICTLFPFEDDMKDYYYIPRKGRNNSSGKLYSRYRSKYAKKRKMQALSDSAASTSVAHIQQQPEIDESLALAIKALLHNGNMKWEETSVNWRKTYHLRQRDLKSLNCNDFLESWSNYADARVLQLINIDFDSMHATKSDLLFSKWEKFKNLIGLFYAQNIHNAVYKELLSNAASTNKDTQDYIYTILLNAVLPSPARIADNSGKRNKKVTIMESQKCLVLRLATLDDYQTHVDTITNLYYANGASVYPVIIVEGLFDLEIRGFYVYFNGRLHKLTSFIKCLDACFKIFQTLSLQYPLPAEQPWTFIQKFFYEISTKSDAKSPKLSSIFNFLKEHI